MPQSRIVGFPPLAGGAAKVLILGSMPGVASLSAGEYYAHPRNCFWRIMGTLSGVPAEAPYAVRMRALAAAGVALWDVVRSCRRTGSLDTAIDRSSVRVNDFRGFLASHPGIGLICFNGGTAERLYQTLVAGSQDLPDVPRLRLPSTSPAHAARSFEAKLQAWQSALGAVLADQTSARPVSSTASTSRRRSSSRVR
jgi:hypoxanthine-DNA glycosylase